MRKNRLLFWFLVGAVALFLMYILVLIIAWGHINNEPKGKSGAMEIKEELQLPSSYDRDDVERKIYKRDPTTFIDFLDGGIVLVVDIKARDVYYISDGEVVRMDYSFEDVSSLEKNKP